jgi:hypothetical protein
VLLYSKEIVISRLFYREKKTNVTNFLHRQYMAPCFFYQKGHGTAPFYFSLDKTLITPPMQFLNIGNKKYVAFSFHNKYNYKVHIHVFWSKLVLWWYNYFSISLASQSQVRTALKLFIFKHFEKKVLKIMTEQVPTRNL